MNNNYNKNNILSFTIFKTLISNNNDNNNNAIMYNVIIIKYIL